MDEELEVTEVDTTELDESVDCCLEAIDSVLPDTDTVWTDAQIWAQIGKNGEDGRGTYSDIPEHSWDRTSELTRAIYQLYRDVGRQGMTAEEAAKYDALDSCTC